MAFRNTKLLQWKERTQANTASDKQSRDDVVEAAGMLENEVASLMKLPRISKARKRQARRGTEECEKAIPLSRLVSVPCDEQLQKDKLLRIYRIYAAAQKSAQETLDLLNFVSDRSPLTRDLRCRKAINRMAVYEIFSW